MAEERQDVKRSLSLSSLRTIDYGDKNESISSIGTLTQNQRFRSLKYLFLLAPFLYIAHVTVWHYASRESQMHYTKEVVISPLHLRSDSKHIPYTSPSHKVSVILMNYSRPRMIRESSLMRTLLNHPNVGEILLLHGNPETKFEFVHDKVVNLDAVKENDEMGLSLRFYFSQMAKYDWVIHVDDDMEFDTDTLSELLAEFSKNTRRIVGRFGRDLSTTSWIMNHFNGYLSVDTHKQSEVILTKLMVMERNITSSFFEHAHLIWKDIIVPRGEGPLWNGEDIFMSLVANYVYNSTDNYAMNWLDVHDAPDDLKDYDNGELDICGGLTTGIFRVRYWDWQWWRSYFRRNRHYAYRGMLWQTARERLAQLSVS